MASIELSEGKKVSFEGKEGSKRLSVHLQSLLWGDIYERKVISRENTGDDGLRETSRD